MIDPKVNVLMKVWIRCLLLFLIDFCVAELGCLKFFKFSYTIAMLKLYEICLSFFFQFVLLCCTGCRTMLLVCYPLKIHKQLL